MNKLRAIIIDDEKSGIETLKILASRNAELIRVVGSTMNPVEGIDLIEDYKPDVVFLDISMPAMSGFDVLDKLNFRDFKLVFTTAHKEYALQAIKSKAFDYLLKPINNEDYKKCLESVYMEFGKGKPGIEVPPALIDVQVKDGIIYIRQSDIVRLEASRSYTVIYLENDVKHVASKSLVDFENKLDPSTFFRCHKSHIINLQKVKKFVNHNGFYVVMNNGSMADVSKNQKDLLIDRLKSI